MNHSVIWNHPPDGQIDPSPAVILVAVMSVTSMLGLMIHGRPPAVSSSLRTGCFVWIQSAMELWRHSLCRFQFGLWCILWTMWVLSLPVTYSLTPWSRVLLEKLTGSQLVKKFPAFYGIWMFISAFTSARHLSLSWASSIQSYAHIPLLKDSS